MGPRIGGSICRAGDDFAAADLGKRYWIVLNVAVGQFRRGGNNLHYQRCDLADHRAVAVFSLWRLSDRPTAHEMGEHAYRRGVLSRYGPRFSGMGGRHS